MKKIDRSLKRSNWPFRVLISNFPHSVAHFSKSKESVKYFEKSAIIVLRYV